MTYGPVRGRWNIWQRTTDWQRATYWQHAVIPLAAREGPSHVAGVEYRFNKFGYRSDEFDLTGSAPALMFIGCSNTNGAALPWESLWTTIVTKHFASSWKIALRQYNLAWGGTGSDHVAMMVHQCVDILKPRAIFVLWPYIHRLTWFEEPDKRWHFKASATGMGTVRTEYDSYLRLSTDAHCFYNFIRNYNFVDDKLRLRNIPFVCGSVEPIERAILERYVNIKPYAGHVEFQGDLAHDNTHFGDRTHVKIAEMMIERAGGIGLNAHFN